MENNYSLMIGKRITSFILHPFRIIVALSLVVALPFCQNIFILSAQTWTQVGGDIDGEAADDWSGISVSLSTDGKRVAIGAWSNDGNGVGSGHVRVYAESGGIWTQVGNDIDGEAESDQSGISVSLSADGMRVAIGAYRNKGNGTLAGHVRVYAESGGAWTKLGGDIDGEAVDNWSGYSVSLSADGKRVAIGAFKNDDNGNEAGHVRVYAESAGAWTKVGDDIDGEAPGDWSGLRVSLSEDGMRLAIGAKKNDGNGTDAGHVRVYSESGGTWTQLGSDIDGEAAGDNFENVSLSADGKRLAIGASGNDGNGTNAGHVRVYSESGGTWTQLGSDIDGETAGDGFGLFVSLSTDGKRLAAGANHNDGNGLDAGHVRVFWENGGVWSQVGGDIDGEAAGDESGNEVSISGDGTRIAIGAPLNDGSETNAGHVRIYKEMPLDTDMDCYDNSVCQKLELFPNPADDQIQLHYAGKINEIHLISTQGFTIHTYEKDGNLNQISIQQIPSGLYALMIRINDKWMMKKIIKQ